MGSILKYLDVTPIAVVSGVVPISLAVVIVLNGCAPGLKDTALGTRRGDLGDTTTVLRSGSEEELQRVVTNRNVATEVRIAGIRKLAEMGSTAAIPRLVECTDLYDPITRTYPALETVVGMGTVCVDAVHGFVLKASPASQEKQIMHAGYILRALEGNKMADRWAEENRQRVPVLTYQMLMYRESPF